MKIINNFLASVFYLNQYFTLSTETLFLDTIVFEMETKTSFCHTYNWLNIVLGTQHPKRRRMCYFMYSLLFVFDVTDFVEMFVPFEIVFNSGISVSSSLFEYSDVQEIVCCNDFLNIFTGSLHLCNKFSKTE